MVSIDYQYTDCFHPKLTIAKDRITFKFPKDYNVYLRIRCIALGRLIVSDIYDVRMNTLRGQFILINDKFIIVMKDNSRFPAKSYEEEDNVRDN